MALTIMTALELVGLDALMARTTGSPEVIIGLIDGPVAVHHPDLESKHIRAVGGEKEAFCIEQSGAACRHGTFVAGMLLGQRTSAAAAICPGCRLLVRPIFAETILGNGELPSATPQELASAIGETIDEGARVLNLSVALLQPSPQGGRELQAALDYAAQRGVIMIAAAGNGGVVGSSVITRHPWVIPVAGCDLQGRVTSQSNLGSSVGRRGVSAPAENITSLGTEGKPLTFGGTSVAAPFVTGAVALLWSEFPAAPAAELLLAVRRARSPRQVAIVPPLLDAMASHQFMLGRGYAVDSRRNQRKP